MSVQLLDCKSFINEKLGETYLQTVLVVAVRELERYKYISYILRSLIYCCQYHVQRTHEFQNQPTKGIGFFRRNLEPAWYTVSTASGLHRFLLPSSLHQKIPPVRQFSQYGIFLRNGSLFFLILCMVVDNWNI